MIPTLGPEVRNPRFTDRTCAFALINICESLLRMSVPVTSWPNWEWMTGASRGCITSRTVRVAAWLEED